MFGYICYNEILSSHLTRGAWIEITSGNKRRERQQSHLTRGAWIEIVVYQQCIWRRARRTSHEVRGLKYFRMIRFYMF